MMIPGKKVQGCAFGLFVMMSTHLIAAPINGEITPVLSPFGAQANVTDSVIQLGSDSWRYEYTVHNESNCLYRSEGLCVGDGDSWLDSWALPYFNDADITNIASPDKWSYSIETIGVPDETIGWDGVAAWQDPSDPNFQGATSPFTDVDQVLYWFATEPYQDGWGQQGINPGTSVSGFSFDAGFGATKAPHQTTFYFTGTGIPRQTISGDPLFPNSPTLSGQVTQVSEPASLGMLAVGLLGLLGARLRRAI